MHYNVSQIEDWVFENVVLDSSPDCSLHLRTNKAFYLFMVDQQVPKSISGWLTYVGWSLKPQMLERKIFS